jgi:hypothetical protein
VFCATPKGDGGKDILGLVAMLAVLIVAPYMGELAAGSYMGAVGAVGATTQGLISGAATLGFAIAGGAVVRALFPPTIPDMPGAGSFDQSPTYSWPTIPDMPGAGSFDQSPTYSWTPGGNTVVEGVSLPELYGTHRVTPPIIGKYIETTGDKQYLNLLFAVATGPLDSIDAIRIKDTPLEYYEGTRAETQLGNVDQPVLQYFADTRTDVAVGTKLTWPDDWDATETYSEDDLVTYGGSHWKSLQDNNTGHTPAEDSWWTADGNWVSSMRIPTGVRTPRRYGSGLNIES